MISVIVPALNEEEVIGRCLRSVKNQRYSKKHEVIVVDNDSTDRTVEIAQKYADKVIFEEEKGKYAACNRGAREANGEILAFLDADTVVLENWLSEMSKAFEGPSVIGATCPVKPLNYDPVSFLYFNLYNKLVKASVQLRQPKIWGAALALRKDVFHKVGGFSNTVNFEDLDLVGRLKYLGEFVMMEDTLALSSPRTVKTKGLIGSFRHYFIRYIVKGIRYRT